MGSRANDSAAADRVARDATIGARRSLQSDRRERERVSSSPIRLRSLRSARLPEQLVPQRRLPHTRLVPGPVQDTHAQSAHPKTILEFSGRHRAQSFRFAALD